MGLFHGMEYMENNKVEEGVFYANIKADPDYQVSPVKGVNFIFDALILMK